jgi:predicted RNase H-like nuclease (RuvC/YqgF family)
MDFKQYKQKKKRKVNPNIPRPNLFSHEKKIKETDTKIETQDIEIHRLRHELKLANSRIRQLEMKIDDIFKVAVNRRNS